MTTTITNTEILDKVIQQLQHNWTDSQGKAYADYITDFEGKTLQIEATVKWYWHTYSNYVTIDGVRYHESDYDYKDDFSDLEIEAWLDGEPIKVDEAYIESNLLLD